MPTGLERVKSDLDMPGPRQRPGVAIETTEQRQQRELAAFHLASGQRLFDEGNDREAAIELQRAIYLSPYEADAHLLLGRVYLRAGRLAEAIDAFKISLWSQETAAAHLALAEAYTRGNNETAARAEAQRALEVPPSPEAK